MKILEEKDNILSAQNEMIISLKEEPRDLEPASDYRSAQERIEFGERT